MSRATLQPTTHTPLGADFAPTLARLRELVDQSTTGLLTAEEPVQPDWELLDLCAHALTHLAAERDAMAQRILPRMDFGTRYTDQDRAQDEALAAEAHARERAGVAFLRKAKKLEATTPAGIYAKAILVRISRTGATELAMSLARDLVNCAELRAVLWRAAVKERP